MGSLDEIVTMVRFKVEQSFTFPGVDVTDTVARSAVAKTFEVAEDDVTIEISHIRRLSGTAGETQLAGSDVDISIKIDGPTRADTIKAKCMDTIAVSQAFAQAYVISHSEAAGNEIRAPEVTADAPSMEIEIDFTIKGASEIVTEKPETFAAARRVVDAEKFENGTVQLPTTTTELKLSVQTTSEAKASAAATDTVIHTNPETIATAVGLVTTPTSVFEVVEAPTTSAAASSDTEEPSLDSEFSGASRLVTVVARLLSVLICAVVANEA